MELVVGEVVLGELIRGGAVSERSRVLVTGSKFPG